MSFPCGCAATPRPGHADRCVKHAAWGCHAQPGAAAPAPRPRVSLRIDCPPCRLASDGAGLGRDRSDGAPS